MRFALFTLLLAITALRATGQQQYTPVRLFDMAATADLVTYGTISRLDERCYYLECFNERNRKITIRVVKYAGRKGSFRWAPYAAGQRVFVFLKRNGPEYQLASPGIEAELPLLRDSLVIDMQCFSQGIVQSLSPKGVITPEYRNAQTFMVGQRSVFGLRFTPRYLYESVMAFRDCYQVILKKPDTYPSFTCFNFFDRNIREKTEAKKRRSKLMKLMYTDMEQTQIKNCK